jgi:hypothetical protein
MQKCEEELSTLPDNFTELPVAEAVEILAVNRIVDSTFYFECKRKQEELARWITSQP